MNWLARIRRWLIQDAPVHLPDSILDGYIEDGRMELLFPAHRIIADNYANGHDQIAQSQFMTVILVVQARMRSEFRDDAKSIRLVPVFDLPENLPNRSVTV